MVPAMSSVFHALPSTLPRCLESTCSFRIAPPCLSTTTNTKWTPRTRNSMVVACVVSLTPDLSTSVDDHEEDQDGVAKIGARVRVTVPLKVYHAPKIPELDLKGLEGEIKDYVSLWKGKHLSANLPFKIQFVTEVGGRSVRFFAHLRDDEFELVQ